MSALAAVDLIDAQGQPIDGLVEVRSPEQATTTEEQVVLRQAAGLGQVTHVLFRRFPASLGKRRSPSQVAAFVVDNTRRTHKKADLAELHRKLWLQGATPLLYVAWPTSVDILACARNPDFWKPNADSEHAQYAPAESVDLDVADPQKRNKAAVKSAATVHAALQGRLSARRLVEGTFWDDHKNQELAKDKAAAHQLLIQAIEEADRKLEGENHPLRRKLLVLTILIKYLEDRAVIPADFFGEFCGGVKSLAELLRRGTVAQVLKAVKCLEKKFNGDVFSLADHKQELTTKDLREVAAVAEADSLAGQRHFWKLFSFEHIPVEVISRIYQRFVTSPGAVYTPPLLVSLILDQAMPYDGLTGSEKVLDPACGSGIFLVGAFKRLVNHWRSRNRWKRPTAADVTGILTDGIFGVEYDSNAVNLTAFSLALALCDALEPPVIWNELRFDKLRGRNLREGDFFVPATTSKKSESAWPLQFDVIVGNPPFVEGAPQASTIPQKQLAYKFLKNGLQLLGFGGSLCLIQPNGILYNSGTLDLRQDLIGTCRLNAILDFVSIRGLFDGGDTKPIAWHAVRDDAPDDWIDHLTFRRTFAASEGIFFEIDHYDWHAVSKADAMKEPFVWRINLLGGGRLHELSRRLRSHQTLRELIESKGSSWDYGEGFIAGKTGKRIPAPFLTGKRLLPSRAFTKDGINMNELEVVKDTHFRSHYRESRYSPPLVLIKAHDSLPTAFWDDGFIAYRDKVIGIHSPKSEVSALRGIYQLLKERRRFYRFCCGLHGTQAWSGLATVPLKQDIDQLPFPNNAAELRLTFWEEALQDDVIDRMAEYVRLGQESDLLKRPPHKEELAEYAKLFVRLLGSLYGNLRSLEPTVFNDVTVQPFCFGEKPDDVSWLDTDAAGQLGDPIHAELGEALRAVRVVRWYSHNVILLVKPSLLRYWIPSTAIRDADDTLVDIRQQGW